MSEEVYLRLGVEPLINAWGTVTRVGGSLMRPEVVEAMSMATRHFVDLDELQARAGQHVAGLLGVEAAYITSGAAAGLTISTAACIAGCDLANIARLPDTRGMRNEVIIHRIQRSPYDQAMRLAGAEMVEFGLAKRTYAWEFEAVVTPQSVAAAYYIEHANAHTLSLAEFAAVAHKHGLPVIVDAAAELPPVLNLHAFIEQGADLVVFSGGKDIGGPQASGLIVGRRDLIKACAMNANPNHSVGRPMKVGKEEIVGLVTALELYLKQDFEQEMQQWEHQVAYLTENLNNALPSLVAKRVFPGEPGIQPTTIPRVYVSWDTACLPLTRDQVQQQLKAGKPRIVVGESGASLVINPQTLQPGEEQIVAQRIVEVLRS